MLDVGDPAPKFTLPSDTGEEIPLESLRGKHVVLYFYPRDERLGGIDSKRATRRCA